MFGASLLLSAVLANLPPPALNPSSGSGALPWVTATALAARLHVERGLDVHPAVGYQGGRPIMLAVVELDPASRLRAEVRTAVAFLRMAEAARQDGVTLQVSSGFRTHAEQLELFRLYQRGRGPLASRPGTSNHQSGHALDIVMQQPAVRLWMKRNAWRFGFYRTVPSERWHWEYW